MKHRHDRMDHLEKLTVEYMAQHDIHGVVFDLDDTLVPEYAGILEDQILEQIKRIAYAGLQVAIVTNNFRKVYCQRIIDQLHKAEIDILIIENAFKPFPFSLQLIQKYFGLAPHQIALVGDGILTDRLGAAIAGYQYISPNWFRRPFYKHPLLFSMRELVVLFSDALRLVFLKHRPQVTWLLADSNKQELSRRKFLFLINPDSSQTDVMKLKAGIREIFNFETDSFYIHVVQDIRQIHRKFASNVRQGSYTNIVVAGGDGTIREAITLIANNNPKVVLGILPTGTGNLLAKALKIPMDARAALEIACNGAVEPVSITRINNTYATLIAGMGVDAEVMAQTSTELKKQWGPLAYIISAIHVAFTKQKSMFWVSLDGQPPLLRHADGVLVVQRNQFSRAFLPIDLSAEDEASRLEEASRLDVCILKSNHWLDGISIIRNLFQGNYETSSDALEHYRCQRVQVSSFPPQKIQVDGDMIEATRIDARVLENHLLMSVPLQLTHSTPDPESETAVSPDAPYAMAGSSRSGK